MYVNCHSTAFLSFPFMFLRVHIIIFKWVCSRSLGLSVKVNTKDLLSALNSRRKMPFQVPCSSWGSCRKHSSQEIGLEFSMRLHKITHLISQNTTKQAWNFSWRMYTAGATRPSVTTNKARAPRTFAKWCKWRKKSLCSSHSKLAPTIATPPATMRAAPQPWPAAPGVRDTYTHSISIAASPLAFQPPNSFRFLSEEIRFGEQCQKDTHSIHLSNFSNICQSSRHVRTWTKLLWPLVESLLVNCIWHRALSKGIEAGKEKQSQEVIVVFIATMFLSMLFISIFFMSPQRDISVKPRPRKAVPSNWYASHSQTPGIL